MKLDDLSGLPVLPGGRFWRVGHPYIEGSWVYGMYGVAHKPRHYDKNRLQVELVKRREEVSQQRVEETPVQRFIRTMFGRDYDMQETRVERDSVLFTEPCQGTHPQAVLDAANRIVKRVRAEAAVTELLGDYPPKRLEVK